MSQLNSSVQTKAVTQAGNDASVATSDALTSPCPICSSTMGCKPIVVEKPVQVHLASYGYSARTLGLNSGLHEVTVQCLEQKCLECESEFASGQDMDNTIKNIVRALQAQFGLPSTLPKA